MVDIDKFLPKTDNTFPLSHTHFPQQWHSASSQSNLHKMPPPPPQEDTVPYIFILKWTSTKVNLLTPPPTLRLSTKNRTDHKTPPPPPPYNDNKLYSYMDFDKSQPPQFPSEWQPFGIRLFWYLPPPPYPKMTLAISLIEHHKMPTLSNDNISD